MFARQDEIREYLERCATEIGARPHLRFGATVTGGGARRGRRAYGRVEVNGSERSDGAGRRSAAWAGCQTRPTPTCPAWRTSRGPSFHSAEWDHDADCGQAGRGDRHRRERDPVRPADRAGGRAAPPLPAHRRRGSSPSATGRSRRLERAIYRRFPSVQRAYRRFIYWALESGWSPSRLEPADPRSSRGRLARLHIRRQISDPELRRKVTPDYVMGCKRILISNDYYPALDRDERRGRSPMASSGSPRTRHRHRRRPRARGRRDHPRHRLPRAGHAHRHRGSAAAAGPTWRGLGRARDAGAPRHRGRRLPQPVLPARAQHRARAQLDRPHDRGAGPLRQRGAAPRCDGAGALVGRAQRPRRRSASTRAPGPARRVPSGRRAGCRSWYLDASGRNTTLWPDYTFRFRRQTARFDEREYVLAGSRPEPPFVMAPRSRHAGTHARMPQTIAYGRSASST